MNGRTSLSASQQMRLRETPQTLALVVKTLALKSSPTRIWRAATASEIAGLRRFIWRAVDYSVSLVHAIQSFDFLGAVGDHRSQYQINFLFQAIVALLGLWRAKVIQQRQTRHLPD